MIVAGFGLMIVTSMPSSRSDLRGLGTGIIELTGLADNDRSATDDQYGMNGMILGHKGAI